MENDQSSDHEGELERLRRALLTITAERDKLLVENRRLAEGSGAASPRIPVEMDGASSGSVYAKNQHAGVLSPNNNSPLSDRMQLYRSLFRGRDDMYAQLWQNRQSGKVGYSPSCKHEWNRALCQKPHGKCNDCTNREFLLLTDSVIENHLEGKVTVGVYPLLENDLCHFVAIDFDKCSWREDSVAFLDTCRIMGIPAALERSRSGNGGHVWIFFSELIAASEARKLGCNLLTETMSRRHELSMDSYDRLIPGQDTAPKGGFGNLIALPFQKWPAEKGNSLFVDNNFNPYPDQWSFLASVGRLNAATVEKIVRKAVVTGQVLGVRSASFEGDDQPWNAPPSGKVPESLPAGPFPATVNMVIGNMVFVEKTGLSSPLLNKIKRLAAFQNPEFYKKQQMRLSTARTPRVISCTEEFPQHVGIPRGCLDELQTLFAKLGIKGKISDSRFQGSELQINFHGQLTFVQKSATSELLKHNDGILVAPSGSGKTVMGIFVIAARKTNTLVLVHRRPLMEQWQAQLASFLDMDPREIGQIGGGKDRRSGRLDVAMLQSLVRRGEVNDLVAGYGNVIIDECHHLPAITFEQILRQVKARYVLGLTATPYRRDGQQPIIQMQCGPLRHEIKQKDTRSQSAIEHILICRNTSFKLSALETEPSIQNIYAQLMSDETRNRLILDDMMKSLDEGRYPILLTERREHLDFFVNELTKRSKNVVVLRGGMGAKQRRDLAEHLSTIPDKESRVLLATGRYIGEGFDDARLDTLFLALPVSWKGTLTQYAGRLHRLYAGKSEVRIYDYVDRNVPVLARMFQRRLRGYGAMGYKTDASDGLGVKTGNAGKPRDLSGQLGLF